MPVTNAPSESSFPPEPQPSRSKKEPNRHSTGTGKHHHSKHRHRSPQKSSTGKHKGRKTKMAKLFKRKDDKGNEGHHHSSSGHRYRHQSPYKGYGRSHSADYNLDSRHRGHRHGRSPDRHHGHHSSPHRRHRSPYRSPYRSPHRHRSPHRSHHHSPYRRRGHSSDPYQRYASPERQNDHNNEKPNGGEGVLTEPPKSPEPSLPPENIFLPEPPALDRLNREVTLPQPSRDARYGEDSLLMKVSSMERAYKGDSLLRDVASYGQRDTTLPRVRTTDSDSAYKKYSSLLRGRSPERTARQDRYPSRGSSPELHYRGRSLGRDVSPVRRYESEDEEDDDYFVADKVREYYSTLKSNTNRPNKPTIPEPKRNYKENPKVLSI
ncbi:uncharacterized protein C2orf16-like [Thalassophryne amazonica]|uniref:uncharacterized protein C2orf16-like n=1 Tax=Thalassophryne amazonica TaxID=390379 RepID=UPI001471A790|nr:uncharacterized protein C2orf16-like [Thalassophryne amazonica]